MFLLVFNIISLKKEQYDTKKEQQALKQQKAELQKELAELKSSTAGVQLGFLFIDEPPFLDDKGVQAYCDALEAIQKRYSSLKIMAITHDPEMKARFPQSVDVVKTAEGSKVIYS